MPLFGDLDVREWVGERVGGNILDQLCKSIAGSGYSPTKTTRYARFWLPLDSMSKFGRTSLALSLIGLVSLVMVITLPSFFFGGFGFVLIFVGWPLLFFLLLMAVIVALRPPSG